LRGIKSRSGIGKLERERDRESDRETGEGER
jgi:hypothetical protein